MQVYKEPKRIGSLNTVEMKQIIKHNNRTSVYSKSNEKTALSMTAASHGMQSNDKNFMNIN